MSDTIKAAVIIGVCLMLGLWGAGWLNRFPDEFTINDIGKLNIHLRGDMLNTEPIHIELAD